MKLLLLNDDSLTRTAQVFINGLRRQGIYMHFSYDLYSDLERIAPDMVLCLNHTSRRKVFQDYQQNVPYAILLDQEKYPEEFEYPEDESCTIISTDMDTNYAAWVIKASSRLQKNNFALRKKVIELEDKLAARKIIDQAKGRLMDQLGYKEAEAYKYIRRTAMNQRRTLKEVALSILNSTSIKQMEVSS